MPPRALTKREQADWERQVLLACARRARPWYASPVWITTIFLTIGGVVLASLGLHIAMRLKNERLDK